MIKPLTRVLFNPMITGLSVGSRSHKGNSCFEHILVWMFLLFFTTE